MLTSDDLKKLSAPFDEKTLGVKVQATSKDKTKAALVCYLQHTDVYARLESVDLAWSMEVSSSQHVRDSYFVRVKLTVKGITRENAGEGEDEKSATSDAIKRAAMLFGVGRYLYDSEPVWVPYNEQTDRYKSFTVADYQGALKRGQAPLPLANKESSRPALAPVSQGPAPAAKSTVAPTKTRTQLTAEILRAAATLKLKKEEIVAWVKELFGVAVDGMTDEQMAAFLEQLQFEIGRNKGA